MIVRELPFAAYMVDPIQLHLAHDPAALVEHVYGRLQEHLNAWALEHAVDIPAESVWRAEHKEEGLVPGVRFYATWSPDPLKGCEFRQGPADGTLLALPRQSLRGEPPAHYVLPGLIRPISDLYASGGPLPDIEDAVHRFIYERAGIDPAEDRWVYELKA